MKNLLCRVLLVVLLNIPAIFVVAQTTDTAKARMKSEATLYFSNRNYAEALNLYRGLLNAYPAEPEYLYGAGVCIIHMNGDMEEAIRLLRATAVADYNPRSLFYLGRAYHLFYSFDDAIKAYSKFIIKGKRSDIKAFKVERCIEMARNGIEFTRSGQPVHVQLAREIKPEELQNASEINGSGKIMPKPIEFCSKTDVRNGYRPWMFLPSYTEVNEYIFTTGYERQKKNNKQLFRIKNLNHQTWGIPEPLNEVINTNYDEEFPYFDAATSTLYFSSNGHSSMGGYDIFKSVYDWNLKTWSRPENLGFPINSPYDDFLYITDQFSHSASFVSSRNAQSGLLFLYKIRLQKDTLGVRFLSVDDIRKASELEVERPEPVQQVLVESMLPQKIKTDSIAKPAIETGNYKRILAEAMFLQIKADSAARITRDLRIIARESPNDSTKKQLISDILKNDKLAKSLQREADQKFAEARKLRNISLPANDTSISAVVAHSEINGITLYKYNNPGNAMQVSGNIPTGADTAKPQKQKVKEVAKRNDAFSILDVSPYHDANPIPQGLKEIPGLVYRIQLGVFSKPKPHNEFGGITPIASEIPAGTSVVKYYAGVFYSISSVSKALDMIRSKGFSDAFIVAFMDGKPITTEKAREIEFSGLQP